ncbi:MAG: NUDIX domain-containing protein [Kiritimatiellae bacterium]|nr:NUDIX domain-containing protein [Kiritimatiellia bacterium]
MKKKKHIEILARGVFIDRGKVLLCHTKGAENTYLPGGHVEFEESAKTALVREIKEELGRNAVIGRFLGVVEHSFIQKGKRHCEINLVFEMRIKGLNSVTEPVSHENYIEFLWVSLKGLYSISLEPAVLCKFLLSWLKKGKPDQGWMTNL